MSSWPIPSQARRLSCSAAAGAVGSIAGQLAKQRGARVVGIAGGAEKCRHLVEELGFDACVDRHADNWRELFDDATPDGVDVDFENVGGPIMDHASWPAEHRRTSVAVWPDLGVRHVQRRQRPTRPAQRKPVADAASLPCGASSSPTTSNRYGEIIGKLAAALGEARGRTTRPSSTDWRTLGETLNQALSGGTRGKAVIQVAPRPCARRLTTRRRCRQPRAGRPTSRTLAESTRRSARFGLVRRLHFTPEDLPGRPLG